MKQSIPYPARTRLERDRSLRLAIQILFNAQRTLNLIDAGSTISINNQFRDVVAEMVDSYTAEINRLKAVSFANQGVVELCPSKT